MLKYELSDDCRDAHKGARLEGKEREHIRARLLDSRLSTDRNENVPLESNGAKCRAQEEISDPNPWTDNRTLPVGFKVANDMSSAKVRLTDRRRTAKAGSSQSALEASI